MKSDFLRLALGVPKGQPITRAHVNRAYPGMPLVQEILWRQIQGQSVRDVEVNMEPGDPAEDKE